MPRVIAFASHKGGVGKSTLIALLALKMAEKGKSVLACDFDPQGSLTFLLTEQNLPEEANCFRLFKGQPFEPLPISGNLRLLGANLSLSLAEHRPSPSTLQLPAQALSDLQNLCLIDTPTGFHRPLSIAGLIAADAFVVPVDPSPLSVSGLVDFLNGLEDLREKYHREPKFLGVVLNLAETHTLVTQRIHRILERLLGQDRILAVLPKRTRLRELALNRKVPDDPSVIEPIEALAKAILEGGKDDG